MPEHRGTEWPRGGRTADAMDRTFAAFAECIPAPVALLTPDARIRYLNTAFARTMGLQAERFLHGPLPDHWLMYPQEDLPRWRQLLQEAVQSDTCAGPVRFCLRSTDGSKIDVQAHAASPAGVLDCPAGFVLVTFQQVHEAAGPEQKPAEGSNRHEGLIEAPSDALFALDPAGRFLSVNDSWLQRFGYAAEEVIGTPAMDLVGPEFHAACQTTLEAVCAGRTKNNLLCRAIAKTGESINILVNLTPVFDSAGTVSHVLGTAGDITELTQIQEELRRSEERLRILFQHAPDGCYLCDLQGRFLDVNQAAAQVSGRTREELIGASLLELDLVPKSQRPRIATLLSMAASGRPLPRTEFRACRKDGTEGTVEITGHPVIIGGQTLLLGAARDITERKRAEDKLKESLSLLQATLESTADGIVVVDGQGKIKDFNERFRELWRLPNEVLATRDGRCAWAASAPLLKDPDGCLADLRELHHHPEQNGHGTIPFRDGRVIEYCSKPQSVGNQVAGRVWSFHDVTDAYRARQEQDRLLHQVTAINEELTHFAYVVSHDLKAPLRGIRVLAEWLCADCGDRLGDEAKENLGLLQNRVDRMHNLIDGILQYSRVGRILEDVVPVDLNILLPEIIDAIAPPAHITIRVDGRLPVIEGEKTRITQVFQNLLSNAVKFMDKPVGEVVVAGAEDADGWTFRVSDNGPGIEQKHFERIFKIFQTLAPRDEFESTGVGLALVKKIVEYYGGKVWVESELGQGSTFLFTFPTGNQRTHHEKLQTSAVG